MVGGTIYGGCSPAEQPRGLDNAPEKASWRGTWRCLKKKRK